MNYKVLLTVLILVSGRLCDAQVGQEEKSQHPVSANAVTLKGDLTNIVNVNDPALLLSIEYQFRTWVSFTQEAGVLFDVNEDSSPESFSGYKIRDELRAYFHPLAFENGLMYVGVNALYRSMNLGENITVGYGCQNGWMYSCDYLKSMGREVKSQKIGGGLRLGMIKPMGQRLTLEADIGCSLTYHDLGVAQEPSGVTYFTDDALLNWDPEGWWLRPSFNARLGIVLFKRKTQ